MKRILYISILIATGLLYACSNEFLTVAPRSELTDLTFWKSENDATLALNGCYLNWEQYSNIAMFDGASDNAYEKSNFGYMKFGNGTLTPATYTQTGSWIDGKTRSAYFSYLSCAWFDYAQIYKYNNFLSHIDDVPMDAEKKARYKSEVRFLRAYDYFWKVMLHGDMPLVTTVITADAKLARDPAATVKQFILKELTEIAPMLPIQNNIDSKGHITRGAAIALKARLELFMGNFKDAMADAKAVIDMSVYELYPDYRSLFLESSEATNKEVILGIQYIKDVYPEHFEQLSAPAGDTGWSALNAVKSIVDAYECSNGKTIDDPTSGYDINNPFKDRDPRLAMTIYYPGEFINGLHGDRYYNTLDQYLLNGDLNPDYHNLPNASRSGMNIKKWIDPKSPGMGGYPPNFGNNFHVIRLAEMYLTYAEAAIESGTNTALALDYINKVRNRAGHISATSLTRELVRRERRVELAFEGLRYFDIARWDLGAQVMNGPLYGSRLGTIDAKGKVTWKGDGKVVTIENYIVLETRTFHPDRKYLFPVPQSEMDANPNMVQNPGY